MVSGFRFKFDVFFLIQLIVLGFRRINAYMLEHGFGFGCRKFGLLV